ncbi:MAG: hypothetical protein AB7O96_10390 [Pseudobdellovibrionaceae bacterium]
MKNLFWIVCLVTYTGTAAASFSENHRRYMSPFDVVSSLYNKFPKSREEASGHSIFNECGALKSSSYLNLGGKNLISNKPVSEKPSVSFMRFYGVCLMSFVDVDFSAAAFGQKVEKGESRKKWLARYFPSRLIEGYKLESAGGFAQFFMKTWSSFPAADRLEMTEHLVKHLIGSKKVIEDLGFVKNYEVLISILQESVDGSKGLSESFPQLIVLIATRDEFLSY